MKLLIYAYRSDRHIWCISYLLSSLQFLTMLWSRNSSIASTPPTVAPTGLSAEKLQFTMIIILLDIGNWRSIAHLKFVVHLFQTCTMSYFTGSLYFVSPYSRWVTGFSQGLYNDCAGLLSNTSMLSIGTQSAISEPTWNSHHWITGGLSLT